MKVVLDKASLRFPNFQLDVSFVLEGNVVALFGASGAGKTTILEVIAGLKRLNSGRLDLNGDSADDPHSKRFTPPRNRHLGYVPQSGALFPHLNVLDNITYGAPADHAKTLEHVLDVLELRDVLKRSVRDLSGGEQRRVALARALLAEPRLLLLDEPLTGIDDRLKSRIIEYLVRVRDEFNVPMIYVTHTREEVLALCDRVIVIDRGRVVEEGEPREVLRERRTRNG